MIHFWMHRLYWFVSILRLFSNWVEIYKNKFAGKSTSLLRLRNGVKLSAFHSDSIIPIIDEIYREKVYGDLDGLGDSPVIIDIGAHIGIFTTLAAKKYPRGIVHSYEPSRNNFELLRRNIKENRFDHCFLHNEAVDSTSGKETLYIRGENAGTNSMLIRSEVKEEVQAIALSEVLAKVSSCDFLKMDVEGVEERALNSLKDEEFKKIGTLAVECSSEYREQLKARCMPLGFTEVSFVHSSLVLRRQNL